MLEINGHRVVLDCVYPPIPTNAFDWCAYLDGQEENGAYGYGATKAAAIADLLSVLAELNDA